MVYAAVAIVMLAVGTWRLQTAESRRGGADEQPAGVHGNGAGVVGMPTAAGGANEVRMHGEARASAEEEFVYRFISQIVELHRLRESSEETRVELYEVLLNAFGKERPNVMKKIGQRLWNELVSKIPDKSQGA